MSLEKCPLCGCEEIGEGYFDGSGGLINITKLFPKVEKVLVNVCTECGYIIAMKVLRPKQFKKKN